MRLIYYVKDDLRVELSVSDVLASTMVKAGKAKYTKRDAEIQARKAAEAAEAKKAAKKKAQAK